ncbi:hypothetical protein [Pelagicoccus mobilis]|uniref:Uncharacterized protein n=1 Tax=Pelagicoccus mobilis TaxID=415221 RepID=A0A934S3N4_9BACT|nr:hypothetical protein [Pelagicoccus mobilis]MBK1879192.1 hypothetical protein [Pelagicoccus mobilis]
MSKNPSRLKKALVRILEPLRSLNRSLPTISPYAKNMSVPGFKLFIQGHTILIEKPKPRESKKER